MKLKIYKIGSLILLFTSLITALVLLTLTIINVATKTGEVFDKVMYIICFVLIILFNSLEIYNSFLSYNKGSQYVKNLAFNDDNSLNRNFLIIVLGGAIIIFVIFIYAILLYCGLEIPLSGLAKDIVGIIISFSFVLINDFVIILLFPILGKDDPSMFNN